MKRTPQDWKTPAEDHEGMLSAEEQATDKAFTPPKLERHETLPKITFGSHLFGGDSQMHS